MLQSVVNVKIYSPILYGKKKKKSKAHNKIENIDQDSFHRTSNLKKKKIYFFNFIFTQYKQKP